MMYNLGPPSGSLPERTKPASPIKLSRILCRSAADLLSGEVTSAMVVKR